MPDTAYVESWLLDSTSYASSGFCTTPLAASDCAFLRMLSLTIGGAKPLAKSAPSHSLLLGAGPKSGPTLNLLWAQIA